MNKAFCGLFLITSFVAASSFFNTRRSLALMMPKIGDLTSNHTEIDNIDEVRKLQEAIKNLTAENKQLKSLLDASKGAPIKYPSLPAWYKSLKAATPNSLVVDSVVREFSNEAWRTSEGGFLGTDFVHSSTRAAVRILEYLLVNGTSSSPSLGEMAPAQSSSNLSEVTDSEPSEGGEPYPRLIGPAYFSEAAESHRGLCHGGSMCALMDDALGWMGFCASGTPRGWTGYTVQVDTTLKKAVPVGSLLRLEAWVQRREGKRKIWVGAKLVDPTDGSVHCTAKGLFLISREDSEKDSQASSKL
jgi:acyl-coenzyme A thioesterase PaaI-like protein